MQLTNPPTDAQASTEPAAAPMSMEELLAQSAAPEPRQLHRGEVVDGSVLEVQRDGLLIDLVGIGSKSEGVVPVHEMHSMVTHPAMGLCAIIGVNGKYLVVQPVGETWTGECPADQLTSV